MKPLISTEFFDVYSAPVTNDGLQSGRQERERAAALSLVRAVFGPTARIDHSPEGAPILSGTTKTTRISISHDSDTCLLATGKTASPIGVDIERPRAQLKRVAPRFLSPCETARLESIGDEEKRTDFLLRCWTAKEAVYKCALTPGLGLKEIVTSQAMDEAEARGERFRLWNYPCGKNATITLAMKTEL